MAPLADLLVIMALLLFGSWLAYTMSRALRRDAQWTERVELFAERRGLQEDQAEAPVLDSVITRNSLRRWWSGNPALTQPARGSRVFRGLIGKHPFVMDEVWIKSGVFSSRSVLLRLSVELSNVPQNLEVWPASWLRRFIRKAGFKSQAFLGRSPEWLVWRLSDAPDKRAHERGFLNLERVRVLETYQQTKGGIYLLQGKLFLIRNRITEWPIDPDELYEDLAYLIKQMR